MKEGFDSEVGLNKWSQVWPPRRIQEAGGEQFGSSAIYQPGSPGGAMMQSMLKGWNMGSLCRAGGNLLCCCCCRLSFTSIKGPSHSICSSFLSSFENKLHFEFLINSYKQSCCPGDGQWLVDQSLQRPRPCGLKTAQAAVLLLCLYNCLLWLVMYQSSHSLRWTIMLLILAILGTYKNRNWFWHIVKR